MTRHLASTRHFPVTYAPTGQHVIVSDSFNDRPGQGGCLVLTPVLDRGIYTPQSGPVVQWPLPGAVGGPGGAQPWMGMDPSAPATWCRAYSPQPGMVSQLNFDGAKYQGNTPMGGTWHYPSPVRDRADIKRRWWRRGLPGEDAASSHQGPGGQPH